MKNDISQSLGLHLVNINDYAEIYQNILLSSRDKAIFTFLEFGARQVSIDDKCHFAIVSLLSEFEPRQKLNRSQMSFDCFIGYILSISMCMQNFITLSSRDSAVITFSEFGARQSLDRWKMSFRNLLARSCQYQCLRNSLSKYSTQEIGPFSLFYNLALGKNSTDDKCHFAIPWARSCQYQCVCKILSKYSKRVKS